MQLSNIGSTLKFYQRAGEVFQCRGLVRSVGRRTHRNQSGQQAQPNPKKRVGVETGTSTSLHTMREVLAADVINHQTLAGKMASGRVPHLPELTGSQQVLSTVVVSRFSVFWSELLR